MIFDFTCSVAKPTGVANALNELPTDFDTPTTNIPCKYIRSEHKQVDPMSAELVTVAEEKFFFPIGTDVQKGDQITELEFQNGESASSKKFIVEASYENVNGFRGRTHVVVTARSL